MNSPNALRETCWIRPMPLHVGQTVTSVPGSTPVASQRAHGTATRYGTSRVTPVAAAASSISTSAAISAPRAPPRVRVESRSSPKNAEKMSAKLPKSNELGRKPPLLSPA